MKRKNGGKIARWVSAKTERRLGVAAPFALALCVALGGSVESARADDGVKTAPLPLGTIAILRTPTLETIKAANAAESVVTGSFRWRADGNGVEIVDAIDKKATEIVVPSEIDGKPVTKIGVGAFYECGALETLTVPSGVKEVGAEAFNSCWRLSTATFDDGLQTLGEGAFMNCVALKSATFGDGLQRVGDFAFANCPALETLMFPDDLTAIGFGAFAECESLKSLTLPSGLTSIRDCAFEGCDALKAIEVAKGNASFRSVDGVLFSADGKTLLRCPAAKEGSEYAVPEGVTSIGDGAFAGCRSLSSLTFPAGLTSIGDSAFYGCSSLSSLTLPAGLTSIGAGAFWGYNSLSSIVVSESNKRFRSIDGVLFTADGKTLLRYPAAKEGSEYAVPAGVTSIGKNAFYGCSSLGSLTLPTGLTSIGDGAFEGCSSLSSLVFSAGLTSIGFFAFEGCSSLSSLTLPAGLTSIGDRAFSGCRSLSSLTLPAEVESIGVRAFSDCAALEAVDVSEGNRFFRSVDGVLFSADGKTLVCYPAGKAATEYAIPDGVETIAAGAFGRCAALTAISIPDGVVEIGDRAFEGCKSLKSLTLPDGVKSVGDFALAGCDALRTVRIGDGLEAFGRRAFGWGDKQAVALTVCGPSGSVVEKYARENGLRFEAVDAETATNDAGDGE